MLVHIVMGYKTFNSVKLSWMLAYTRKYSLRSDQLGLHNLIEYTMKKQHWRHFIACRPIRIIRQGGTRASGHRHVVNETGSICGVVANTSATFVSLLRVVFAYGSGYTGYALIFYRNHINKHKKRGNRRIYNTEHSNLDILGPCIKIHLTIHQY